MGAASLERVKIYTVVDNDSYKEGFKSDWGLSFYLECEKEGLIKKLLMDVSGSPNIFFSNINAFNIDIKAVKTIFISHWHWDHAGALLKVVKDLSNVTIYAPTHNKEVEGELRKLSAEVISCDTPLTISDGIYSTGKLSNKVEEHSLVLNVKDKGLVILVGCSHPGIINIVKKAVEVTGVNRIYGIMGGLHISETKEGKEVYIFKAKK